MLLLNTNSVGTEYIVRGGAGQLQFYWGTEWLAAGKVESLLIVISLSAQLQCRSRRQEARLLRTWSKNDSHSFCHHIGIAVD